LNSEVRREAQLEGFWKQSDKENIGTYRREINRKPMKTELWWLHNL
jgi:hypothetical protein